MREPSTAEHLPFLVRIQGRDYVWDPVKGLDQAAVATVERYIWKKAFRLRFPAAMAGLSVDDLVQEGRLGALWAAQKFHPGFEVKYLTYASLWIHQRMAKAMGQGEVSIPKLKRDALRKAGELPPISSLDSCQEGTDLALSGCLAAPEETEQDAEDQGQKQLLHEAMADLCERDREVLQHRFGVGVPTSTLEEIGRMLGLSRERIRQLEQRAMLRLRRVLARKGVTR